MDALIGNEFVDKKTKYEYAYSMNFNFPGWNHLNNASVFSNESLYNKKRTVGNFANLSVAWKNMLYLSGSIRNDIVSSMPRDNRSFTYPSVSLGFIFTELAPLKNNILTFGKIRASYAEVGMAGDYTITILHLMVVVFIWEIRLFIQLMEQWLIFHIIRCMTLT